MAETPQPGFQLLRDLGTEGVVAFLSQCAHHSSCSSRSSLPDRCHRIDWLKEKASQAQQTNRSYEISEPDQFKSAIYILFMPRTIIASERKLQVSVTMQSTFFLFLQCNLNRYDSVGSQRNKKSSTSDSRTRISFEHFHIIKEFRRKI